MPVQIKKAEKKQVRLKLAIQGPSGSGKTLGALALAKNLAPNGKICVIDTENESASLYADRYEFDTIVMHAPFLSKKYEEAIKAAVEAGYEVLVIDQISHEWAGEGGLLRRKEELDQRPGANSYTNWSKFTPEHEHFIATITQAPIDIIATMRSKTEYIMETNDKGKQVPRKVGTAPVQRDGVDYEFSIVFDVQLDHKAIVSKDRTSLFDERIVNLCDPKLAEELKTWRQSGAVANPSPEPTGLDAPPAESAKQPAKKEKVKGSKSADVIDVVKRTGKQGNEYYQIVGEHNAVLATCFDNKHFDAALAAKGHNATIEFEQTGDWRIVTGVQVNA